MNEDATIAYADGKVKAELGDDPAREERLSLLVYAPQSDGYRTAIHPVCRPVYPGFVCRRG
ncbi:MAG: hypothetical protein ACLU9S_20600 [Oscillospiraceae bacterium]